MMQKKNAWTTMKKRHEAGTMIILAIKHVNVGCRLGCEAQDASADDEHAYFEGEADDENAFDFSGVHDNFVRRLALRVCENNFISGFILFSRVIQFRSRNCNVRSFPLLL